MSVLVIIPAYNEQESIEKVVDNLKKNYPQYDYIIINDGSTQCIYEQLKKAQTNGKTIKEYLGVYYQIDDPNEPDVNKTEKRIITYKIQ